MQDKEQPTGSMRDQTLRRFRSRENEERTRKKRKVSTGLLVINMAVIALLYYFYLDQKPADTYRASSFGYRDATFRFSMSRARNTGEYVFYLSARPAGQLPVAIRFNGGMADLIIRCEEDVIVTQPVARDVGALTLRPGESKIAREILDPHELFLYAQSHPDRLVEGRRLLLFRGRAHLPLSAEVRIRAEQPVSTSIDFNHEVDQ